MAQVPIIVDLAIAHDLYGPILVGNGLVAAATSMIERRRIPKGDQGQQTLPDHQGRDAQ